MDAEVRVEMAARLSLLEQFGPNLARPYADTLNASRFSNMKELRFNADDGLWRVAYAELYFVRDKHWPAFTVEDLDLALVDYAGRERRFGGK